MNLKQRLWTFQVFPCCLSQRFFLFHFQKSPVARWFDTVTRASTFVTTRVITMIFNVMVSMVFNVTVVRVIQRQKIFETYISVVG